MNLFPVFLNLTDRRVLLVGGGRVASGKLGGLLGAGAIVTVVAPQVAAELVRPGVDILRRAFEPRDVDGSWLVVAAATREVNRHVADVADRRRIFVNAVDDVEAASAYLGGVVRKGGTTLAISTDGRAPALAGLLREALDDVLPEELGEWLACAENLRTRWRAEGVPMGDRRPLLLRVLNDLYAARRAA